VSAVPDSRPALGPRLGIFRQAAALLAAALVTRGELAALELTEARDRAGRWLALAVAGAVLLLAALLVAGLLVATLFWDSHRVAAIAAVALVYGAAGAGLIAVMVSQVRTAPPLLDATLTELRRDCVELAGGDRRVRG
jgi:uncharacterized membrane protein YqjE